MTRDGGEGGDVAAASVTAPAHDEFALHGEWRIEKYNRPGAKPELMEPDEVVEAENLFLNEGINAIWNLVCSTGGTVYSNANARIGVGNGTTAASSSQTALQGASTLYKGMNSGYPTAGSNQQAVFRADFGGSEANFAWEEITVDNGSTPGTNLNRLVTSLGTKASGTTWTAELTLSIS